MFSTPSFEIPLITGGPIGDQLLAQLAEVLPVPMSKTYVRRLRSRHRQLPSTEDPATFEFEVPRG